MTKLDEPEIAAVRGVLEREPRARLALLFGSFAEGRARPDSDVDVAVLADGPLSADDLLDWTGRLAAAAGRPVDLVDLSRAGEPILGQAMKGRRLLGDESLHAAWLTRQLIDRADFLPYRQRILEERRRAWIGR